MDAVRSVANLDCLLDDLIGRVPAAKQAALLTSADSDIGLVAYEMAMLVTRVGQNMSAPVKSSTAPANAC